VGTVIGEVSQVINNTGSVANNSTMLPNLPEEKDKKFVTTKILD
jgi:hypothetical protein